MNAIYAKNSNMMVSIRYVTILHAHGIRIRIMREGRQPTIRKGTGAISARAPIFARNASMRDRATTTTAGTTNKVMVVVAVITAAAEVNMVAEAIIVAGTTTAKEVALEAEHNMFGNNNDDYN
jgi:hypothetical protein